jgi:Anthrone oxygenase
MRSLVDFIVVLLAALIAAAILIAGGLITRFGNQPINAIVATWNANSPPPEWEALRDRWWHLHVIRTWIALFGFALLLIATRMKAAAEEAQRSAPIRNG